MKKRSQIDRIIDDHLTTLRNSKHIYASKVDFAVTQTEALVKKIEAVKNDRKKVPQRARVGQGEPAKVARFQQPDGSFINLPVETSCP